LTGVVGLAVYCGMVWMVIIRCRSIWRDATAPATHRGLAIGATAATIGVVFASVFVNSLLATFVMEILWVLWALTFVIARAGTARYANAQIAPPARVIALAA